MARDYIKEGFWSEADTLTQWLFLHSRKNPDRPALAGGAGTVSWRGLEARVARVAAGLRHRGIHKGDVVAVQLPNVPEFVVAYLAACRLGAIFCTLHMPYRGAEIETILAHSGAKLFIDKGFDFAALEAAGPLEASQAHPASADPFLLLYTSGTTASPKGVLHPYRSLLGNGRLGAREHGLTASDRVLCAAPLSHLYGLYSLHCAWAVGACTVLLPAFSPPELVKVIETERPTALWTAPAHVAACRASNLFEARDWSSLKLAIVSGSSAPESLIRYLSEKMPECAVTQLWGMTELQAGLYTRPEDPFEMSATTAGRPSPGTEVRLSEGGELQVRGPLLFSGYYKNPEATKEAFTSDGWFRTGDLAAEKDGYYAITGRTKDIINRGGVKFNPVDVEMLLDSHPKILQSAIVPMPDPILGERACAFVVLKNGIAGIDLEELTDYLLEKNIAKNKLPERLVMIDEMPLTPTRKVIKGRLRLPE